MTVSQRAKKGLKAWGQQLRDDLQVEKSKNESEDGHIWSNQDMDPTPPHKRTWRWQNYLLYFIGTGFNNWQGGSSVIGVGLGWKVAIAIAFITSSISGCVQAANSKAAARYHVGFPAMARTVYGMWGSSYQVAVRAILAAVWYATRMYEGASYLDIMLKAVFGHSYVNMPNHVPESIGYQTKDFLCYLLFWLIYTPFLFRRPHQIKLLFTMACVFCFPAVFGLFIYCIASSKGKLGLGDNFDSTGSLGTSDTAWLVIYGMTSSISNGSPYIESIPDMARWSKTPWAIIPPTLFCNILFNPISAVLGILGTSALQNSSGQTLWKPWDVMSYILEEHWNSGARFGVFCLAFVWAFQTLCQNISSNLIPFGSDTSMLWPRHLTMTRGYIICHLLAWCICPWKIYVSAETFLNFMGAYGIFMGPAVSIMLCEYYNISKGNVFVPSIYIGSKKNENYWYTGGWNIQAYIAYLASVAICMIGFVNKVGATVPDAGVKLGYLGWFLTFTTGWIFYYIIVKIWPHQNVKNVKGLKWEEMATRQGDIIDGLSVEGPRSTDAESRTSSVKKDDGHITQAPVSLD